jgi:hypothetical protein
MPTAWIVPAGTDTAPEAQPGDYLLRPDGERVEIGSFDASCTWVGTVDASLLPDLPAVDSPTKAPDQEAVLLAARGVESAETHRGG